MLDKWTGIPTELLFTAIAILVAFVWKDLRTQVKEIKDQSQKRSEQIVALRILVKQICTKLKIPNGQIWPDKEEE